jgi:hypothetical protein
MLKGKLRAATCVARSIGQFKAAPKERLDFNRLRKLHDRDFLPFGTVAHADF